MLAFLVVLLAGVLIGLARHGSIRNVATARIRLGWAIIGALALQALAQVFPRSWSIPAFVLVIASFAAVFVWAAANRTIPGMFLIGVGALMNVTVILANGGMPISADAAARTGWTGPETERLVIRGKHYIETGDARLSFLGDVIPLGGAPAVASAGDLVIWAGLILVIQDVMRPRGRRVRVEARMPAGDALLREIDLRERSPSRIIDLGDRTDLERRERREHDDR